MKTKLTLTLLALTAVSINLHAENSALPAPLPDLMNQEQLAQWNADQAAAAQTTASTYTESSNQFYTGKPYVADAGGYVFKYRTYNPEMSRWTSSDPTGYPDGLNNQSYAPVPTGAVDPKGLFTVNVFGPDLASQQATVASVNTTYTVTASSVIVSDVSASAPGTADFTTYSAWASATGVGGVTLNITVTGDNPNTIWNQQIATNDPQEGEGAPPPWAGNANAQGIYNYTDTGNASYQAGGGAANASYFSDNPTKGLLDAPITWTATLTISSGGVTDAVITYGFTIE